MKTGTIQALLYVLFAVGAAIAFITLMIPSLSEYFMIFLCIGGFIVVSGIVLSVIIVRVPGCPYCNRIFYFRYPSPTSCPHCDKKL